MDVLPFQGAENASVGLANANIKVEVSPTLSISGAASKGERSFPERFITEIRRGANPVKFERERAEASLIRRQSIVDNYRYYKETMPSLSDNQACMLVCGYSLTPLEADNVVSVLASAGERLPEDADPDVLSDSCKDQDIKGCASAYEDELRDLWSALIVEEVTSQSPCQKRTKQILSGMSSSDADAFTRLCSFSPWTHVGMDRKPRPIPVLQRAEGETSWTYNRGAIAAEELQSLEGLGLISGNRFATFTVSKGSRFVFALGEKHIILTGGPNISGERKICFGNYSFLPTGMELARICDAQMHENLVGSMKDKAKTVGLEVVGPIG